jgi:hypothetical protein
MKIKTLALLVASCWAAHP